MKIYTPEQLRDILNKHKLWLESGGKEGVRADLRDADLRDADLSFTKCYYTKGDIICIGNQGKEQRSITLAKKTRMAFIGCFKGTFDEARKAIREKYGDKAEAITGGYGLTLMAMEAIEKEKEA